jgi:hypothetical protein
LPIIYVGGFKTRSFNFESDFLQGNYVYFIIALDEKTTGLNLKSG